MALHVDGAVQWSCVDVVSIGLSHVVVLSAGCWGVPLGWSFGAGSGADAALGRGRIPLPPAPCDCLYALMLSVQMQHAASAPCPVPPGDEAARQKELASGIMPPPLLSHAAINAAFVRCLPIGGGLGHVCRLHLRAFRHVAAGLVRLVMPERGLNMWLQAWCGSSCLNVA